MATPRIFLSSTCYDLNEIRDGLYSFIENLGYIPVFSDKNDIFYHPDLHSHESCIKEIENCQIFILIIGGRFGGNYIYDVEKSIVNAEYQTAKKLKIPIFTFVKREVHEDHRLFIRNKKENPELYNKIDYPSIEKQSTSEKIFDFIDEVRKSNKNNAYFTFEFARDIKEIIKKQFAGMFFDFLWNRKKDIENNITVELLTNLNLLGQKTEEIIENIYKKIDEKSAISEINKLDDILNASKFWNLLGRTFSIGGPPSPERIVELSKITKNEKWNEYLVSKGRFTTKKYGEDGSDITGLIPLNGNEYLPIESLGEQISDHHKKITENLNRYFEAFKSLDEEERVKVLKNIV